MDTGVGVSTFSADLPLNELAARSWRCGAQQALEGVSVSRRYASVAAPLLCSADGRQLGGGLLPVRLNQDCLGGAQRVSMQVATRFSCGSLARER